MKKITIVDKDRPGLLADVTKVLAEKGINIEYLEAGEHKHIGIIILSVDRYNDALRELRDASFCAFTEDVIIIKLEDKPGALAEIALRFKDADINMRSIKIIKREKGYGIVAVCAEKTKKSAELLKDVIIS